MVSTESRRVLPYPAATLFDLAADVEQYPQYMGGWISAHIYRRGPDVLLAEQSLGFGPVRMAFRSRAELNRPGRIEVTSNDPQFRRFRLLWRFEPGDSGDCRVTLALDLELRAWLLQKAVDRLAPAATDDALSAFEQRARRLFGPR